MVLRLTLTAAATVAFIATGCSAALPAPSLTVRTAGLSISASSPPDHLPRPSSDCPLYSANLTRWSDFYGVHVEGSVISPPGWSFSFTRTLQVLNPSEVVVTMVPKRTTSPSSSTVRGTMPGSIEQHVYGFWRRPWGSTPIGTANVHCGRHVERLERLPMTLPADPAEIPTVPPPPPPK